MDMQSGRVILREAGIADLVGFTANGAYLDGQTFYSYSDMSPFRVEDSLHEGLIIDVLPGGIAIGAYTSDLVDDDVVGIYTISKETGRKLLVKGAEPIFYPFDLSLQ